MTRGADAVRSFARAAVLLVAIASVARARIVTVPDPMAIDYVYLRNGMKVILAPDRAASSVVVHVRYEAGAAIERSVESGYTALLAKLMTAGSVHVKDFDARIDAVGGWTTSTATSDYLAVTDQAPANALELVLWLEAERMAGLATGITPEGVATAREALYAEWRAAYVDEPYALATRELQRALWTGPLAAQANPVLGDGYAAHVANEGAVRWFASERLTPNNATVVVAGRFDPVATKKLVERYFSWIPTRETKTGRGNLWVAPRDSAVEVTVKDPIAKVIVAFRCEPFDPAIEVIAQLLSGGPSSRLWRRLVDGKLATDVHAEIVRQRAGELRIEATPAPGVDPAKLGAAIRAEIAALRAPLPGSPHNEKLRIEPPSSDEVARAVAAVETEFLVAAENLAVRADMLASWSAYSGGGPLLSEWRARLRKRGVDELQRTLWKWLADSASVTVIARPEAP